MLVVVVVQRYELYFILEGKMRLYIQHGLTMNLVVCIDISELIPMVRLAS